MAERIRHIEHFPGGRVEIVFTKWRLLTADDVPAVPLREQDFCYTARKFLIASDEELVKVKDFLLDNEVQFEKEENIELSESEKEYVQNSGLTDKTLLQQVLDEAAEFETDLTAMNLSSTEQDFYRKWLRPKQDSKLFIGD